MTVRIEDIQARYIRDLRALRPGLEAWWEKVISARGEEGAWKRWPTGISGHPRVLAVFRQYFLEIEELNDKKTGPPPGPDPKGEEMWGHDDESEDIEFEVHVEWLIFNVADEAPDLEDLVNGICFVPIGEDLEGEVA